MKKILFSLTALVVLCFLVIAFRPNMITDANETKAKYETTYSKYLDWKGVKLHYIDKGQGQPIVLFHGFAGSFCNWNDLAATIPEGYRLIIPDLPGLGLSEFPEIDENEDIIELFADFSTTLFEELDLRDAAVVGNSLGGYVGWETTVRNSDRVSSLVLLNSAGYSIADTDAFFIRLSKTKFFKQIIRKGVPTMLTKTAAKRCLGDPSKAKVTGLQSFHDMLNDEGNLQTVSIIGGCGQEPDSTKISQIEVPTLIVWGDLDNIIPVEHAYKFHRDIENSELLIYEGSGHVPMIENTERLSKDLMEFWSKHEKSQQYYGLQIVDED